MLNRILKRACCKLHITCKYELITGVKISATRAHQLKTSKYELSFPGLPTPELLSSVLGFSFLLSARTSCLCFLCCEGQVLLVLLLLIARATSLTGRENSVIRQIIKKIKSQKNFKAAYLERV
jgi:hypothetical protein